MVRYKVTLTAEERQQLEKLVSSGKGATCFPASLKKTMPSSEPTRGTVILTRRQVGPPPGKDCRPLRECLCYFLACSLKN